jgi:hypothetical protein
VVCFFLIISAARYLMRTPGWKEMIIDGVPAPVEGQVSPAEEPPAP